MAQDQAVLVSIPGIGKKLAERIIFELKEKVAAAGVAAVGRGRRRGRRRGEGEVVAALQALGYSLAEAREASRIALADVGVGGDARGPGQGGAAEPRSATEPCTAHGPRRPVPAASAWRPRGSIEARPSRAARSARVSRVEDLEHRVADVEHHVAQRAGRLVRARARA